jgi:hypothetical protein
MKDARMAAVMQAIRARYPWTRTVVEPYGDPDGDRNIRWWIWVLNARLSDEDLPTFAVRIARQIYEPDPRPFFVGFMTRRQSASYLGRRAALARWRRILRGRLTRRQAAARRRVGVA